MIRQLSEEESIATCHGPCPCGFRVVARLEPTLAQRLLVALLDDLGVELLEVATVQFKDHRARLNRLFTEPSEAQRADHVGPAGAVDRLAAGHAATLALADETDEPSRSGLLDRQEEFVVAQHYPGRQHEILEGVLFS